ncbi:MAG: hypothetical protein IJM19_05720 [Ruminococcus sp.]|nr:hypothetical protein [Ruminococcus sp.]
MKEYIYSLAQLPESDRVFFTEMLSYISENVKDITRNGDEVTVSYEGTDEETIIEKIKELEKMILSKLNKKVTEVKVKTLTDHTDRKTFNNEDIFRPMLDKGIVRQLGSGVFAYSGIFLKVFRYFCRKVEDSAEKLFPELDKVNYEVPVLIPVADYEEGKYFETFPHHIMFKTTLKNDISVIDRFAKNGIKDESILDETRTPENVLRTAACVPVYPMFRNQEISDEKPACVMVSGKCFRNEGNNVSELARLNEFYMKEYVFIGTPEQSKKYIENAYALWDFWCEKFNLNCKIDTANDSFFASNYKKLQLFQMLGDSKREFKLLIPSTGNYISCSSANFHRTHFTKVYNIRTKQNGAFCHSSCFAFGIERLTYAFLAQNGLDSDKWNDGIREEIGKYVNLKEGTV